MHAEDPEATSFERQESLDAAFLEHLKESERRLSAARNSALDLIVGTTIVVILVGGAALGIMHLRTTEPRDRADAFETSKPVSTPVAKPSAADTEKEINTLTGKGLNDKPGR